jgi:ABC-type sugar transport system ATPase subunit
VKIFSLGREPSKFGVIHWEELYRRASKLLADLHLSIDPHYTHPQLGIGQQTVGGDREGTVTRGPHPGA